MHILIEEIEFYDSLLYIGVYKDQPGFENNWIAGSHGANKCLFTGDADSTIKMEGDKAN